MLQEGAKMLDFLPQLLLLYNCNDCNRLVIDFNRIVSNCNHIVFDDNRVVKDFNYVVVDCYRAVTIASLQLHLVTSCRFNSYNRLL